MNPHTVLVTTVLPMPLLAGAQILNIRCSARDGASLSFEIDLDRMAVKFGPIPATRVTISGTYINFSLTLNDATVVPLHQSHRPSTDSPASQERNACREHMPAENTEVLSSPRASLTLLSC